MAASAKRVEARVRGRTGALTPQVFGATTQLLLQSGVPRALERGHERAKGSLLVDLQLGAAPLNLEHSIERGGDALLIAVLTGEDLTTEREALLALLQGELPPLEVERTARLCQLRHLLIGEPDTVLRDTP